MSPVIVGMGTTVNFLGLGFNFGDDFSDDEPTLPEPALTMAEVIEQDLTLKAIDEMIALLDEPTAPGDGFPFLADGHLEELIPAFK